MPDPVLVSHVSSSSSLIGTPAGRLFSNSVVMGAANLLSRAIGYGYIILMARRLDARYIGAYAVFVTSAMLLELVANLGLDKVLIREITCRSVIDGQSYFRAALLIRLLMALPSAALVWFLLSIFFKGQLLVSPLTSAIYLSAIFPIVASRNCESFLTAYERLFPVALSQLCEKVAIFGAVLLLTLGVISFGGLLSFAPLASMIRLSVVANYTARSWARSIAPSQRPAMTTLVKQALQLFAVEVLALVYFRSDVFLISKMDGLRKTGVYQVAYKIFDCCLSLFSGFLIAAFPRLIRARSRRSLNLLLGGGVALLSIPVSIVISFRHLILGAIKPDYVSGSSSLVWLMLTVPLVYVTSTFANTAIAAGQIRILIFAAFLLLITNITLNLFLIPRWSIDGAAVSTFACELLSACVLGPFVLRSLPKGSM